MQITEANLDTTFGICDLWRLNLQAEDWGVYWQNPYAGGMLRNSCCPNDLSGLLSYLEVRALFPNSKNSVVSPTLAFLGQR